MKKYLHTGLACAALVLAGCVAAPVQTPTPVSAGDFSSPEQALTYHVVLGELATQRGDSKAGVQQYASAAQVSTDPTLAQYATLLAYKDGDDSLALELTHRWLQLAPSDNSARHFEAVLNTRLGNLDTAVSEFEKLLAESPGDNLQLISDLLGQETDAKQGLPVMQKLVAGQPESAKAHFTLAQLAMHYQDAPLAIDETRRALVLKPDYDQALILEARALLSAGNETEALQLLKACAEAQPDNTRIHLAYAAVLAQTGQDWLAQTEFLAIDTRHPDNPDALYSLGLLALKDNDLTAAQDYFTRLLKTGQRDNDARYLLGNTSELAKRYPKALQWYQQVNGGSNWLTAQISVARVLMSQHKPDAARGYIDDVVGMDPDDGVQLRIAEAQLFSDTGDNKTALLVLDQGLTENPGNPDLMYARALLQEDMGDAAAAEDGLRQILAEQPDNADALNALGYMLVVHTTHYEEARGYMAKALQLKPDDPAIIDSMGWVEYRLGNYPQALSYLRKAYAQLADPEVAAHLTEVLWVTGDKQEAHRIWSSALKQHPGDAALLKVGERFPMIMRVMLLAGLLTLTGCASVPGTALMGAPDENAWQLRRVQLEKLADWELQGRVGIINGKDGGSGSMDWKQRGQVLAFSFHGPFGAGALQVQGDANALWVRSSRGDDFITTDPEQDFIQRLRIPLPVMSMRYWMLGLPDPNAAFTKTVDAKGLLVTLTQRGWHVDYQAYATFSGYDLPTRLQIGRDAVHIKVAVNEWQLQTDIDQHPASTQ